ncbi:MAG: site-specific DNA-methyltransferase [Planctomycetes bacterium]|nr:site-specific DNA-methyltransferase [Planctomycetota bacterium]
MPQSESRRKVERVAAESANLLAEQVAKLRELFPEAVTEGKVDFEKLRATLGDAVDDRPERYSFTWAGRREAVRVLKTPSRATLIPAREESVDFDHTEHLFIEGENLEVLKLLYQSYAGRVKMIYIDPPYNTGNDFIYPDNFTDPLDTYLKLTGQKDAAGNLLQSNPETSGRYHSCWLSMMYPRLFLAKQLLRKEGVIFVSIDDHEAHDLRLVMNEIFGEENFLAQLIWKGRQFPDSRAVTGVSTDHEYVVVYSNGEGAELRGMKRDEGKFSNPDNDPRGPWMSRSILGLATKHQRPNLHYEITDPNTGISYLPPADTGWRYSRERMARLVKDNRILFPPNPKGRPREKKFRAELEREFVSFPSIISDVYTAHGTSEIRDLFGFEAFDFPKPMELIRRLVEQATEEDDLVLDVFAGSCTSAHAVMVQNGKEVGKRRFVMVQLPEPTPEGSEARKAGYATIADIGKERIRRVIAKMQKENEGKLLSERDKAEDLGFKVFKLAPSRFRPWRGLEKRDGEALAKQMELYSDPLIEAWEPEDVIYEVALKEGFSLTCRIEPLPAVSTNAVYRVTDPEREQSFRICLDAKIADATLRALELKAEDLFVCRDRALDDDQAANLALQCRLKTI